MKMTVVLAAALCAEAAWARERTDLFNGRDLSGWTAVADQDVTGDYAASEPTWYATNGTIRTTGTPFGYLRTKRGDFADGRLHVEYRWWRETEKPNSGVFVRLSAERGTFIPTTVENQLCRGMAGDVLGLAGFRFAGFEPQDAYDPAKPLSGITKAPRKGADVEKPFGEWNVLEVELKGDTLVNRLNGVELNRVTGLSVAKGAIALQSEGGAAEFRNVWFEEAAPAAAPGVVRAVIGTSLGDIELELDAAKAPLTVSNFVAYAKAGHYKDTVFHRVIDGFMIQGGGFTADMKQKPTRPPVKNEAANGLRNARGTIAMARTMVVDSATSQFFINLKDNGFLDHRAPNPQMYGYAVFGRVTKGMDVVDKIAKVKTGSKDWFQDVPIEPVVIKGIEVVD